MYIVTVSGRTILRRIAFVCGLLLLAALTSTLGGGALFTTGDGEADKPLTRAASPDNRVALTFDVTWGETELKQILSTLDAHGVKATFFVGGTFLSNYGPTVKQMAGAGHEIGTLGQKIVNLSALPEQDVTSNLMASQSRLAKILGGPVRYFRPPQGPATPELVRLARSADLIAVTHSLDSEDHLGRTADQIAARVVKRAHKGDIILLSASDWSRETNKALPKIIKGLQERGFKLVPISELVPQAVEP